MSRLFYPILFSVTAALAATLWMRHGLPTQWLTALGTAVAQAQPPAPTAKGSPPPWNGAANTSPPGAQRLPPTGQTTAATPADAHSRSRQAPYTQLHIDAPGGPRAMEVTRPMPVPGAQIVARIGTEVILAADVLPTVTAQFQQEAKRCPPEQQQQFFQLLMYQQVHQMVRQKLVVMAMKKEIPEDKFADVEKQMIKVFEEHQLPLMRKQMKVRSDIEVDAKLKAEGSSLKKMRDLFMEQMLISEWQKKETKIDEHVSHRDLLAYYEEHLPEYKFPAKAKFEEIRVNYGRQRGRREAWLAINNLAHRVHAGARLADLAKSHSDSVKAEAGGLHDWTSKGSLKCAALDDALFTLPVGALSKVIDDGRGFVIVRVLDRAEAGTTSFQDAQAEIREKIKEQRMQAAKSKKITAFLEKSKAKVWTIYDDLPQAAEKPGGTKRR